MTFDHAYNEMQASKMDLPTCPYCGHKMILQKRKNGITVVNEGMDGPVHWVTKQTYRYYTRCHNCNARGPLTPLATQAIQDAENKK